jgi:hypothetical protein
MRHLKSNNKVHLHGGFLSLALCTYGHITAWTFHAEFPETAVTADNQLKFGIILED